MSWEDILKQNIPNRLQLIVDDANKAGAEVYWGDKEVGLLFQTVQQRDLFVTELADEVPHEVWQGYDNLTGTEAGYGIKIKFDAFLSGATGLKRRPQQPPDIEVEDEAEEWSYEERREP